MILVILYNVYEKIINKFTILELQQKLIILEK